MSDTPISDSTPHNVAELGVLCRKLERELGATKERIRLLIAERDTARLQASQNWKIREEFRALLGTDDVSTALAVVREMKDRIKRLEEALKDLLIAVTFADPPKEFNGVLCNEALVPIGFVDSARAALESKEAKPCIKQLKTKSCIYCMKVECECSDFDVSADMGAKG